METQIVGSVNKNQLYCAGSLTKLLTTYVSLSLLSEKYDLSKILNDENFLDSISLDTPGNGFLKLFQDIIGSRFTLHDICSYYAGMPYTFDPSEDEIEKVDAGFPFKHHSILDETIFLWMCRHKITPVYPNRSKFHYSEISIIFLGYFLEKVYQVKFEDLYQKYLINKFDLKNSIFSRVRVPGVRIEDLSDRYDYPSIAILDHGYFCYSNGFYTTLNDMATLLKKMFHDPIFNFMQDVTNARAASNRLMNGLAVEIRRAKGDTIYGYEGFSFSGCNIWAYSTHKDTAYLTFHDSEEAVYEIIYDQTLGYDAFDTVPEYTQDDYKLFMETYPFKIEERMIPAEFQGDYHRVRINEKILNTVFKVGPHFIVIRNPEEIKYDVIYVNGKYHIKGKDKIQGSQVGFCKAKSGNRYMFHDGTLYKKIIHPL